MSKGQSLPFNDPPLLVEEKEIKDSMKILRLQQIGSKKEHIMRFDVRRPELYTLLLGSWVILYRVRQCMLRPFTSRQLGWLLGWPFLLKQSLVVCVYNRSSFQGDFERVLWLDNIRVNIHKCNTKLHGGPRTMRDGTSASHVSGPGGRRNATHALSTVTSVPFIIGSADKWCYTLPSSWTPLAPPPPLSPPRHFA